MSVGIDGILTDIFYYKDNKYYYNEAMSIKF